MRPSEHNRQRGIALLAGLVLLAAISLLALVASGSMLLQQRMAGNYCDGQQARRAAAVAVTQGEAILFGIAHDERIPGCLQDCFSPPLNRVIRPQSEVPPQPELEDASWWRNQALESGVDPVSGIPTGEPWSFSSEPPRFLIEELHFEDLASAPAAADAPLLQGIGYYRILGRGVGRGPAAVAVSEAIIARPWLSGAPPGPATGSSGFCTPFKPWYDCGLMAWRQRR